MKIEKENLLLYAVTDRHWAKEETLTAQVEKALKGGVTFVQLREKDIEEEDLFREAEEIGRLCRAYGVPFVLNDDVELACRIGADGVHVGQKDMAVKDARRLLGPDRIIGVSARTPEQARAAEEEGADYISVGAVFPTDSKSDAVEVDHEVLSEICRASGIPVIAIGGITSENVSLLGGSGICGVAVIHGIFGQQDIETGTAELRKKTEEMVRQNGK